ncbi:MAG: toprim domain-containing protein [Rubrobacter sp.]|nr:toprim domain-containing protein [Rubrobacter sp.]
MRVFESLRDRVDLAEVAGRHTELRPSGGASVGRCPHPDHDDENPSFYVYDARFFCYGCGWRGDVADLWAGVSSTKPGIGAALDLAREFGVELPDADPAAQRKADERRRKEAGYLEDAERGHGALTENPGVAGWWERRGFDESMRRRFLLGAHEGHAVIPFWNRGRVEGFVTRRLRGEPKYVLQRAEEFVRGYKPLFAPGRGGGGAFLVEGYVDALALAALGYPAVAVRGTRISERQLEELRRLPGPLHILPDADEPGAMAARDWVEKLYPKALLCPPNYEKENEYRD